MLSRRAFLQALAAGAALGAARKPNFILIFADDLGYGDLGVYGHPTIRTPNLDRMAAEGVRFTNFYSTASLCSPSRAALLTGRYPMRSGIIRVLFPEEEFGIPDQEITLAEALRAAGYRTACIGKWHLGDQPSHRPTRHGFDSYYGLLYSNDMDRRHLPDRPWPPLRLYRNEDVIEEPAVQETLTRRYTEQAVKFIRENKEQPFFLYLPHSMPHWPWFSSERFHGKSQRGVYGDTVEEIDWGVGEILKTLKQEGLDENTVVLFTSDNGGTTGRDAGSNGLLRGGKGSAWEGGFREPFLARWPEKIPAGSLRTGMACTMDLFTTLLSLAGAKRPADRPIDGLNIEEMLTGSGASPRNEFHYYQADQLSAIRLGSWKLHLGGELYNLDRDPSERFDVAKDHPEIVAELRERARRFVAGLHPGKLIPPLPEKWRRR